MFKSFFFLFSVKAGPETVIFGVIMYIGGNFCSLYLILCFTEMIIIKVIYIFKFSRIAAGNEYFITRILILMNFVIISIIVTIRITLKDYETHPGLVWRNLIPLNQLKTKTEAHQNIVK